jgi:hypothetical protein
MPMNRYRIRAKRLGALGFFTQADHYQDFEIESSEPLEVFAERLAAKGFLDSKSGRWIMPGAIAWIEPQ